MSEADFRSYVPFRNSYLLVVCAPPLFSLSFMFVCLIDIAYAPVFS